MTEINRLPRPFRLPIVLRYFEGLTLDEAAQRLRCPAGTVRSRLARACAKLRRGLTRRGVALVGRGSRRCTQFEVRLCIDLIPPVRYHDPGRDRVRGRAGRLAASGLPCPLGAQIHVREQVETDRHDLTPSRCRRHWRGISHSFFREPERAAKEARCWSAAGRGQARRHNPASGPGSDVRRGPRARSPGKTGAQRHDHGLRGEQAARGRRWLVEKMKPSAIGQAQ